MYCIVYRDSVLWWCLSEEQWLVSLVSLQSFCFISSLVSAGFTDTEDIYDIADEGVLWLGREGG